MASTRLEQRRDFVYTGKVDSSGHYDLVNLILEGSPHLSVRLGPALMWEGKGGTF
tara:strand:- start:9180 stop:9344 length:165 start_codon:yes stop_codon:yes gene_type:complete